MSAALLNQDFGSESEGEEFNPAPADDSGNEAGSDVDERVPPTANGHKRHADAKDEDDENVKSNVLGGDEGEEEDEDVADVDDDDEEEAISVCWTSAPHSDTINFIPGSSTQEGEEGSSESVPRCGS